ncbi:class I SAM-dependent methyltransferase [Anaeromicrobium sediminis]|nr:class I SAM-dependent methyltransferase [Anaeromicrobium sediminis]
MENGKGSMTAIVSAFGRAYHALYDEPKIFNDYLAAQFNYKTVSLIIWNF